MEIVINHFEGGMPQDFFQAEDITTVKKIIRGEGVAVKMNVQPYRGNKALVTVFGIWAARGKGGWLHIHMTGDKRNFKHITVVNNPSSRTRYNRVLFRDLRRLLIAHNKWPFGNEGSETEKF